MNIAEIERELSECMRRLASSINRPDVPDAVWGCLMKVGLPFDVVREGFAGQEWGELVREAKRCLHSAHENAGSVPPPRRADRKPDLDVSVDLDDYSRRRAETASDVAALFADGHPEVKGFREAYLGAESARLSEEQARGFRAEDQPEHILDEMLSIAQRLGWRYRWTYRDTWWYLLTGQAPYIQPLRVHYEYVSDEEHYPNMAQLTLILEPWVDAKDLERVYRDVQRQVLGGDNRKKPTRTLDAVRFVARRMREHGRESWSKLHTEWNRSQTHLVRRYESRGALELAFKRFTRAVYHEPTYEPAKPEPWEARGVHKT
jgi:hypothetical protein